ncbi:hypothetical protein EDB83DRAFT_2310838 [Lactarius deliciosus]|nr:hypothetical protein EDB83DRAFT_2310838 [Lactarius deliciosus]
MNYPHTSATDPYAFSFWPDAAASSEEETMAWAQAAGYTQPGLSTDNFSFGDLDAWGQSSALPAAPLSTSDIDWVFGDTVPAGDIFGHGASSLDTIATDTSGFAQAPTLPFPTDPTDDMDALLQDLFSTQPDFLNSLSDTPCRSPLPAGKSFVLTQPKALTDGSSVPSPETDGTGDGIPPFPTLEGAASYFPPGPSSTQLDIAGELQPDQVTYAPPLWFMGDGNLAGQLPPDYLASLAFMNMNGHMSYPTQSDYTQADALTTSETVPPASLGKRSRRYETYGYGLPQADDQNSEEDDSGPQKRARPSARVPGGAESTERTRRSPATRTRHSINDKSKAAGRGAERLASTTVQRVYHRSLPGLSVPQGSVGALEQGQSSWIEERDVETQHDTGGLPQQQIVLQSAENAEVGESQGGLHKIPGNLSVRDRLMLETAQADEERGAVREIKCKLCTTKSPFKTWEIYKRHCKSCEKHPQASKLKFCPKCGDYFGRPDSGVRHRKDKKYQKVCLETSQDEASEKKQTVERLLKEFDARLEHCLRNGEEIGPRFSDIVNKVLTNTSKKVSRR